MFSCQRVGSVGSTWAYANPVINTPIDATSQTPIPLVDPDSGARVRVG
jgi:hypothetical protein